MKAKKDFNKKLLLNKETVSNLDLLAMDSARGGISTDISAINSCDLCLTIEHTCATNCSCTSVGC